MIDNLLLVFKTNEFFLQLHRSLHTSLSYESSSCFSASEYFDATDGMSDVANSDTSSEASSDNSSCTSDASDAGTDAHPSGNVFWLFVVYLSISIQISFKYAISFQYLIYTHSVNT